MTTMEKKENDGVTQEDSVIVTVALDSSETGAFLAIDETREQVGSSAQEPQESNAAVDNEAIVAVSTKRQKKRVWCSDEQLKYLCKCFNETPSPSMEHRQRIAEKINMDLEKVSRWFRYRRGGKNRADSETISSAPEGQKEDSFTSDELWMLNAHYEKDKYPYRSTIEIIVKLLKCSYNKVYNWFRNQRRKDKKNGIVLSPKPNEKTKRTICDKLSTSSAAEEKKRRENGSSPDNSFESLHSRIIFRMKKLLVKLHAKLLEQLDEKLLEQQRKEHKELSDVMDNAKTQTSSLELMKVVFEGLKGKKGESFAETVMDCEAFFKKGGLCCGKYFDCDPIQTCATCGDQFHPVCRDLGRRSNGGENQCPCRIRQAMLFKYRSTDIPLDPCATFLEKCVKNWVHTNRKIAIRVTTAENMEADFGEDFEAFYAKMKKNLPVQKIRNKMIFVFTDDDGDEILFFAMLANEYKDAAKSDLMTIRYLDSVSFINDGDLRTNVYNSVVLGYMGYTASIGYKKSHFWACPPDPKDSYLFRGRPAWQPVPTEKRLIKWYTTLLGLGKTRGVVAEYGRDYEGPQEKKLFKQIEHMICDGGYWNEIIGKKLFIETYGGSQPIQQHVLSDLRAEMKLKDKPIFYIDLISRIMIAIEELPSITSELTKTRDTWKKFLEDNELDFTYRETAKKCLFQKYHAFSPLASLFHVRLSILCLHFLHLTLSPGIRLLHFPRPLKYFVPVFLQLLSPTICHRLPFPAFKSVLYFLNPVSLPSLPFPFLL
ncbi:hypothetical protein GCK72_025996 [Caenorhabditis remanei]|uniref:histone acetyltransferase n=1 Tax=Caenorhabditis remanei TaxID=31234 RepID=A0A6A5G3F9_CAERE|nr:hypothetical protein GCK72_025996 [Caenorhabditis remanei]KAF1749528.1 hypothetical protein GCK72_025996 [Caenorhabditis remanei]